VARGTARRAHRVAHVRVGRGWYPVALLLPAAGAAGPTVRLGARPAVALGYADWPGLVVTFLPVLLVLVVARSAAATALARP
jgi:hypothetical protein